MSKHFWGIASGFAVAMVGGGAVAGEHTLTIHKLGYVATQTNIRYVKVIGAMPETIPVPEKEGDTFSIKVTMPEGVCHTRVSVTSTQGRVDTYANICANGSLTFRVGYGR